VQRLPRGEPIVAGRSHCEHCAHTLRPADLLPLASWLWLRGRCRYCGAGIGAFPILIELGALAIAAWAAIATGGWIFPVSCALGWWLLALAAIDARVFLLPDVLTLPLCAAGLVFAFVVVRDDALAHLAGALGGFAVFAVVSLLYRWLRGREGLGLGDAKLMAAAGAWLGWQALPGLVLIATSGALVFVLCAALLRRDFSWSARIPLGAFLCAGFWIVWLYGPLLPGGF
jgi:leader peptidase (prepilin peptidase)/N-methyltransferase